jgi:2'-5' RNA ligase
LAEALARVVETVRRPGDGVSWVRAENLHYTLRFLGEVEEPRLEAVRRAAGEAVRGGSAFRLAIGEAGAFPDFRRPRVLWIGARQGGPELERLARSLEEALRREGFGRSAKPFQAHLTLGRVRDPARGGGAAERLTARTAELAAGGSGPEFLVDRLTIVHSTLRPEGSLYRAVGEAHLAQAAESR